MTIRTILVDDEKLAIQGLQLRLEKFPDVEVIDTCSNGREAIRKIKTEKPDLVFLDIQMPGFDGFSVVKGIMEIEPPLIVFVTAYQEHAVRAFEANAVNYLMNEVLKKPGVLVFDDKLPSAKSEFSLSSISHPEVIKQFDEYLVNERVSVARLKAKYKIVD